MKNHDKVIICITCGTKRSGGAGLVPNRLSLISDEWACELCTTRNSNALKVCSVCEGKRSDKLMVESKIEPVPVSKPSGPWNCSVCTFMNTDEKSNSCSICSSTRNYGPASELPPPMPSSEESKASHESKASYESKASTQTENKESYNIKIEVDSPSSVDLPNLLGKVLNHHKLRPPPNLSGVWDSTLGIIYATCDEDLGLKGGFLVSGSYKDASSTLQLRGIASASDLRKWKVTGYFFNSALKETKRSTNYFNLDFNGTASEFTGKWFKGDTSGEWEGYIYNF